MGLDYIADINEYGESMVRLYNSNKSEAFMFSELIKEVVIKRKQKLDLSKVPFIELRNCNLIMGLFETDEGIFTLDGENFFCALSLEGYENMLKLLAPFCQKETKAHQYLYEIDTPIGFLFVPAGTW